MTQTMMVTVDEAVEHAWREFDAALSEERRTFRLYREASQRWYERLDAQRELFIRSSRAYGRRLLENTENARSAYEQAFDAYTSASDSASSLQVEYDEAHEAYKAAWQHRVACEGTLEEVCRRRNGTGGRAVTTVDEPPF